jgi:signal transduction histidine kinase
MRWWLGLGLVAVLGAGLVAAVANAQVAVLPAAPAEPLFEIRSAFSASGAGRAFPAQTPGVFVDLPDDWSRTRPGFEGSVWYRFGFVTPPAVDPEDLLAVYAEHACTAMEVQINGAPVYQGSRLAQPSTLHCNHPLLVPLPASLLRAPSDARGNVLDIRIFGHPLQQVGSRHRAGALSRVVVGPQSDLAPYHARRTALQVGAPQAVSATLLLMGSFMFVLGFINRRESHLAYFGALSVGWALADSRLWLRSLPLSHSALEFLLVSMVGFIAWVAVQFLLRYGGVRDERVDRMLPLQTAVVPLSLMIAGSERLNAVATFWYVLLMGEVVAAGVWYLRRTREKREKRSFWLMGGLLGAMGVAGVVELLAQWTGSRPIAAHVAALIAPVIFVVVGLRLVQQQGRARHHAEQDKAQLEQRVAEAKAEIERNFRQLAELRVEQVTERERKRIAADLHDDLGAKLLTIVHTSESERISTLAREALEEMRLSVRGLTGRPVRLADALGDWRAEIVMRLGQSGIENDWEAPAEDLPQRLSARAYVQTTRILREATSNVIKHSNATRCTMRIGIADGDLQFVMQDNGDGVAAEVEHRLDRGHGLAGMKNRAKQLQGQCLVESGPGYGTVIRLTVPLDRALEAS